MSVDKHVEDDWVLVSEKKELPQTTTLNDVFLDGAGIGVGFKNTAVSTLGVVGGILQITGSGITAIGTTMVWLSGK